MNKMQILLIIGAGTISFAGSFGLSWFMKQKESQEIINQAAAETVATQAAESHSEKSEANFSLFENAGDNIEIGLSEKQLQNLIHEIRSRMQEYRSKEQYFEEETQRIDIARQGLQQEVDRLVLLREKVAVSLQQLSREKETLEASLVKINGVEKTNFQHLASTYDKMDTKNAGRILMTMASGPQVQDAVKILYYMNERTAAEVLGEIGNTRPETAVMLSLQLKRVQEKE